MISLWHPFPKDHHWRTTSMGTSKRAMLPRNKLCLRYPFPQDQPVEEDLIIVSNAGDMQTAMLLRNKVSL